MDQSEALVIECDYCGARGRVETNDEKVAEYSAECAGWVTKRWGPTTRHECSRCAKAVTNVNIHEISQVRRQVG